MDGLFDGFSGNVLAGLIASVILLFIGWLIKQIQETIKTQYEGYFDTYNIYKYKFLGGLEDPEVLSRKILVEARFLRKPYAEVFDTKYLFKGYMESYGNHLYFHLRSYQNGAHKEHVTYIFREPLKPEDFYVRVGVISGITENGDPCASPVIISRPKLSDEQVREILGPKKVEIVRESFLKDEILQIYPKLELP